MNYTQWTVCVNATLAKNSATQRKAAVYYLRAVGSRDLIRAAPRSGCAIDAATSEGYLRPIE
jgi:hypothetical protein